ncbi:hypothetical protein HRG84_02030 [Flavisolibacter sp. BT320]|nr:hypothetical protein [Flavisolibacter longurius]
MKTLVTLFFLFLFQLSYGQFLQDVSGKPYLLKPQEEYEGSTFLFASWMKADVKTSNGKIYKDMLVNVDVVQDIPVFFQDETTFAFSEKINEIVVGDSLIKTVYKRGKSLHAAIPNHFYEVILEAPLLVKRIDKNVVEQPTYASSAKSFRYVETKAYFSLAGNDLQKISLTKENAQRIFAENWEAVEAFAKKNTISFKTETGWRQLANYTRTTSSK